VLNKARRQPHPPPISIADRSAFIPAVANPHSAFDNRHSAIIGVSWRLT
jgi:hypothetical protein